MGMTLYPAKFEVFDPDTGQLLCTIASCDVCAEIKMDTIVTVQSWDELSPLIRKAIEAVCDSE